MALVFSLGGRPESCLFGSQLWGGGLLFEVDLLWGRFAPSSFISYTYCGAAESQSVSSLQAN